ncbi:hypothetical protein Nepgr_024897 [Nepenthes gracilis]|uniref:Uncharacterized protein n=1 Tax=Nepenthes gracilis TaxID=150966 RepID=A0AAD3Y0H4_NEPGR|nr:hypothetical protein Nepgr_024897 [Nepenthes gracilis]
MLHPTAKREGDEEIREVFYEVESSEEAVSAIVAKDCHLDLEEQFNKYVNDYAFAGPRTLILTYLELNRTEYTEFTQNSAKARNSLSADREPPIDQVVEKMEDDLILLDATTVENTLLNGVPQCIANLTHAVIKRRVWTGDKMETTNNVGFACKLLRQGMKQVSLHLDSPDIRTLEKIRNKDVISEDQTSCKILRLDGEKLSLGVGILDTEVYEVMKFSQIKRQCSFSLVALSRRHSAKSKEIDDFQSAFHPNKELLLKSIKPPALRLAKHLRDLYGALDCHYGPSQSMTSSVLRHYTQARRCQLGRAASGETHISFSQAHRYGFQEPELGVVVEEAERPMNMLQQP